MSRYSIVPHPSIKQIEWDVKKFCRSLPTYGKYKLLGVPHDHEFSRVEYGKGKEKFVCDHCGLTKY